MGTPNRKTGLDVIRCIALLFVISVHFFLHTGFYDQPVVGWQMTVMVYMRSLFMTCVPLFLMLSGYLLCHKTVSTDYYKRIIPIYITYILAGSACILYDTLTNQKDHGLSSLVIILLSFPDNEMYFWYINMYLGLFLLAPFLNVMYNGLEKPSHKKILVFSLLAMTALPSLINSHQITHPSWWLNPASSNSYHELIPDWWTGIYPVTYYILGCSLREQPLGPKGRAKLPAFLLAFLAAGTYNLYRSYGVPFVKGTWSDHGSILTVLQTVLLFSLFQDMEVRPENKRFSRVLAYISKLSLAAYLLSWIPDQYFYPLLTAYQPAAPLQLHYFPIIVPLVLICSLAMAVAVDLTSRILSRGVFFVAGIMLKNRSTLRCLKIKK